MALDPGMRRRAADHLGTKVSAMVHRDYEALSRWSQGQRSEAYFARAVGDLGEELVLPPRSELENVEVMELGDLVSCEVRASMPLWTAKGVSVLELVNHLRWDEEISVWWNVDVELRWRDGVGPSAGVSSTGG